MRSTLIEKIITTESAGDSTLYGQKGMVYSFLNPVSYLDALNDKELYCSMNGLFADGSLLVAAIRICYGETVTRRSCDMTSISREIMELSAKTGKSIYIVASKQKDVGTAVRMFKDSFSGVNIVGYRNGYFNSEEDMEKEIRHIVELSPDYLIVGMGTIKQEKFLLRVRDAGYQGIGFTCGGFIHQTAHSRTDYYPDWINRTNLRFLYRMWKEPHTRKRYLKAGLIFPACFLWERFFG